MFEDQTVDLLPARTTMRVTHRGGRGGNANARGGDALAISAAVIFVNGNVNNSTLTATSDAATATGGNGGTATGGNGGNAG
jgi:hypothetical protein